MEGTINLNLLNGYGISLGGIMEWSFAILPGDAVYTVNFD
jgi:hypothetical protein